MHKKIDRRSDASGSDINISDNDEGIGGDDMDFDDWGAGGANKQKENKKNKKSKSTTLSKEESPGIENTKKAKKSGVGVWDATDNILSSDEDDDHKQGTGDDSNLIGGGSNGPDKNNHKITNDNSDDLLANYFVMPSNGKTHSQKWAERATAGYDLIAAGKFDLAQESLHRDFGIINFQPLKTYFIDIYTCAYVVLPTMPDSSNLITGIQVM